MAMRARLVHVLTLMLAVLTVMPVLLAHVLTLMRVVAILMIVPKALVHMLIIIKCIQTAEGFPALVLMRIARILIQFRCIAMERCMEMVRCMEIHHQYRTLMPHKERLNEIRI
jgi:hypothetical protein